MRPRLSNLSWCLTTEAVFIVALLAASAQVAESDSSHPCRAHDSPLLCSLPGARSDDTSQQEGDGPSGVPSQSEWETVRWVSAASI